MSDPAARKGWGRFAARLGLGAVLLALIVRQVGEPDFGVPVGPRLLAGVLAAAALLMAGQAVAALRWKVVLGAGSPPWAYLTRLYYIGAFFSLFLPTVVGGDVVRAAAAAQATRRPGGVVASVLVDRLLGVLALVVYGLVGILLAPDVTARLVAAATVELPGAGLVAAAVVGFILLVVLFRRALRSPTLQATVAEGWTAVRELARSPRALASAVALGFVVQGIYILLWVVLARSVALPVPDRLLVLGVPVVSFFAMLPVTLNGLGVREGAWLLLLTGSGIPHDQVVGFSLLYFAANLVAGAIGGLIFVVRGTGTAATPAADAKTS